MGGAARGGAPAQQLEEYVRVAHGVGIPFEGPFHDVGGVFSVHFSLLC